MRKKYLLGIETRHVEKYLSEKKEDAADKPWESLLYEYYCRHNRFEYALRMMKRAAINQDNVSIDVRVKCFREALQNAEKLRDVSGRIPDGDLMDSTHMAEFQVQLRDYLKTMKPRFEGSKNEQKFGSLMEEAENTLMGYIDMFHKVILNCLSDFFLIFHFLPNACFLFPVYFRQITIPFQRWEDSLEIIHECRHYDIDSHTTKLWRSIIFR